MGHIAHYYEPVSSITRESCYLPFLQIASMMCCVHRSVCAQNAYYCKYSDVSFYAVWSTNQSKPLYNVPGFWNEHLQFFPHIHTKLHFVSGVWVTGNFYSQGLSVFLTTSPFNYSSLHSVTGMDWNSQSLNEDSAVNLHLKKKPLRGFGPLANYADRATAASWRSSTNCCG
jgi:hypothetical protein